MSFHNTTDWLAAFFRITRFNFPWYWLLFAGGPQAQCPDYLIKFIVYSSILQVIILSIQVGVMAVITLIGFKHWVVDILLLLLSFRLTLQDHPIILFMDICLNDYIIKCFHSLSHNNMVQFQQEFTVISKMFCD